jgi:hypothetical protein
MGRPLNKRFFGSGAGNQIKVRAKIGSSAEGDGVIVSQRGSKKFKVTVGSDTGDCFIVDKANGALAANEMTISVITDDGVLRRVTKIAAHRVSANGTSYAWNFDASETDGAAQAIDVEGPTIVILTQPVSLTVENEAPSVFSIDITGVAEASATYQWQYNDGTNWINFNQQGGIYLGWDTATLTITATPIAITGYQFRCVVTSSGAANSPLTSAAATLTVTA